MVAYGGSSEQADGEKVKVTRRVLLNDETDSSNTNDLKPLLLYFSSTTTAHGFLRIANTKNKTIRAIWCVFMVIAVSGVSFHFYSILNNHLQHEVSTEMRNNAADFKFPALTVCLTIPYNQQVLATADRIGSLKNITFEQFFNVSTTFLKVALKQKVNIMHYVRKAFAKYGLKHGYFRHLDDYILSCTFGKGGCKKNNFIEIFRRDKGFCITYNPAGHEVKKGPSEGFVLTPFFFGSYHGDGYKVHIFRDGGELLEKGKIELFLHEEGTYPNFHMAKTTLTMANKISLRLKMSEYTRIPIKGSCLDNPKDLMIYEEWAKKVRSYKYTSLTCRSLERQRKIFSNCKCLSEKLPVPGDLHLNEKVLNCHEISENVYFTANGGSLDDDSILGSLNNETKSFVDRQKCHDKILGEMEDSGYWEGICKDSCLSRKYTWSSTTTFWPQIIGGMDYRKYLYKLFVDKANEYAAKYGVFPNATSWMAYVADTGEESTQSLDYYMSEDFGRIVLFTDETKGLLFSEAEAYPLSNLISSIGGILGLWVGISIISLIEIFELMAILGLYTWRRLKHALGR